MGLAPKCHFVPTLPSGSPEIPKIRILAILEAHNFVCRAPIEVRSEQSYNLCREISNNMWHVTWTKGNQGDFRILMVESQIGNLTPDLFGGHNLCFKHPNGLCEPILDIYVLRGFHIINSSIQWILTLAIFLWRFESPSGLQLPKWEFTWECGGSFPHTLPHSQEDEMWLSGFTFGLHLCKPLLWSQAQG